MASDPDEPSGTGSPCRERLRGLGVLELIAVLIALVQPLTPTRTGSTWSPAELFTADPSYLQKVLASLVTVNLLLVVLGVVVWVVGKGDRSD